MIPPILQHFLNQRGMHRDEPDVLAQRDDRVVLRLRDPGADLVVKLDAARAAFDEEAAAMRTLAEIGVPVSRIVELQVGPPAMLVTAWAAGVPITSTTDRAVLNHVGTILRRIHSLPATGPWSGHPSIADWITAWIGIVSLWWRERGIDERLVAALSDWLNSIHPLLGDEHGTQMLFDGRPEHFLVDADNILHLIDVADLQAGDPVMDLAVLELDAPGILDPVLQGYSPTFDERQRIDQLVPFYVVLRALAGAEWQVRVGGDTAVVERNLTVARRMVEEWTTRRSRPEPE
jgi:aminoglycoside phosphotransferase (APT) family kinase protein